MFFGFNLKRLRKMRGLTQAELAEKAGVSVRGYQKYEQDISMPSPENIERLSKALSCKVTEFFEEPGRPPEPRDDVSEALARIESLILKSHQPPQSPKEEETLFIKYRHIIERLEKGSDLDLEIVEEALGLSPSDRASDSETA